MFKKLISKLGSKRNKPAGEIEILSREEYRDMGSLIMEQKPLMILFYDYTCKEFDDISTYMKLVRNSEFKVCGQNIPVFTLDISNYPGKSNVDLARLYNLGTFDSTDMKLTPVPVVFLFLNDSDGKHPVYRRFTGRNYNDIGTFIANYNKQYGEKPKIPCWIMFN